MVRIGDPTQGNQTARASLIVAGLVAAVVWAGYWAWHSEQAPVAVRRGPQDFMFTWRCPQGHRFPARGAFGPRACTCGQPAYPVIRYRCLSGRHGPFELRVMFNSDTGRVSDVEMEPDKWIPAASGVLCPVCGARMTPVPALHPLESRTVEKDQEADGTHDNPPP